MYIFFNGEAFDYALIKLTYSVDFHSFLQLLNSQNLMLFSLRPPSECCSRKQTTLRFNNSLSDIQNSWIGVLLLNYDFFVVKIVHLNRFNLKWVELIDRVYLRLLS